MLDFWLEKIFLSIDSWRIFVYALIVKVIGIRPCKCETKKVLVIHHCKRETKKVIGIRPCKCETKKVGAAVAAPFCLRGTLWHYIFIR